MQWFHAHPDTWWQMPDDAKDELELTREARRKEGVFEGPRLQEWLAKVQAGTTDVLAPFHTEDALRYCFQIPRALERGHKRSRGEGYRQVWIHVKASRARGEVQRLWHPKV